ncbi:MAG: hypothetical protein LUC85_03885 [Bacteroidales bacterium]|nr:hypothetical protein [Bacteroidales bacterium]MCD8393960.1 hypothetical protein [Bacteroidales bacterium]
MNNEMAYLLGMIVGNGEIKREKSQTTVSIEIPHKKLTTEHVEDVELYVRASITDIRGIIEPLVGALLRYDSNARCSIIHFSMGNESYLIREINRIIGRVVSHESMRIPEEIFNAPIDQRKAFLKGFGDVTAYIRRSNAYMDHYSHRVYVEIPKNWHLVVDYCNLLQSINIPVQNIDWGHPNMRDPKLKKLHKGQANFWKKEHQVKIWAVVYEQIGFVVLHKNRCLAIYAHEHRTHFTNNTWASLNRFYWDMSSQNRPKLSHPAESDPFLPLEIRGKHYDSWKEIARDLGYIPMER